MLQPPGFIDSHNLTHVYKLQKLKETLLHIGFSSSPFDPSLFLFRRDSHIIFLLVYVDDIVLIGNNSTLLQSIVQLLDQQFIIKDLGNLYFFSWNRGTTTKYWFDSHTIKIYLFYPRSSTYVGH
jgi:Reverse transcriptase (RNA-dependent DNA polymerase)